MKRQNFNRERGLIASQITIQFDVAENPSPVSARKPEQGQNRFRVPTWFDGEVEEAKRRGREVWIHSEEMRANG
jgi:hypothetical protein